MSMFTWTRGDRQFIVRSTLCQAVHLLAEFFAVLYGRDRNRNSVASHTGLLGPAATTSDKKVRRMESRGRTFSSLRANPWRLGCFRRRSRRSQASSAQTCSDFKSSVVSAGLRPPGGRVAHSLFRIRQERWLVFAFPCQSGRIY